MPNSAWLGRLWETRAFPPQEVEAGRFAVVVKLGDRAWDDPESAPLRGLRICIYTSEDAARGAAARALNTGVTEKQIEIDAQIAEAVKAYVSEPPSAPIKTLRAVTVEDAGGMGGNSAVARRYWASMAARVEQTTRWLNSEEEPVDANPSGEDVEDNEALSASSASAGEAFHFADSSARADTTAESPLEVIDFSSVSASEPDRSGRHIDGRAHHPQQYYHVSHYVLCLCCPLM